MDYTISLPLAQLGLACCCFGGRRLRTYGRSFQIQCPPEVVGNGSPRSTLASRRQGCDDLVRKQAGVHLASFFDRRMISISLAISWGFSAFRYTFAAIALGDPSFTIQDVTPPVMPADALPISEKRLVELFEKTTYSVVNIFDVTIRPQVNFSGGVEVPEGNGSGIVWDKNGHVVTNYHVIGSVLSKNPRNGELVARVTLLTSDGKRKDFEAKLVGADKTKDLAVVKIDAPTELLQPIALGQSENIKVGQRCLAIGNPFGFDHTLTVGIVSGLNRDIYSQTGVVIEGGIQTDAAINPGNSGGPLLDSGGRLIGVNTAIFTRTGTSAGVGFAIPTDTVSRVAPQLISFGRVVRPSLNVQLAPDLIAKQLNVKSGALILSVVDKSNAAKAGLSPTTRGFAGNIILGDVIVAINGLPVTNVVDLTKILDNFNVGDKITLSIQRNGNIVKTPIILEEDMT